MNIENYIRRVCRAMLEDGFDIDQVKAKTGMTGRELKELLAVPPGTLCAQYEYPDNIIQGLVDILVANPGIGIRHAGRMLEEFFNIAVPQADMRSFFDRATVLAELKIEDPTTLFAHEDIELLKGLADMHADVLSMAEICAMWSETTGRHIAVETANKILSVEKPSE